MAAGQPGCTAGACLVRPLRPLEEERAWTYILVVFLLRTGNLTITVVLGLLTALGSPISGQLPQTGGYYLRHQ
jgi:hypothetical protein